MSDKRGPRNKLHSKCADCGYRLFRDKPRSFFCKTSRSHTKRKGVHNVPKGTISTKPRVVKKEEKES